MGGQSMPVGDEKIAFVLVLEPDPVFEHAMIVAEMQAPGGPHARENPLVLTGNRTQNDRLPCPACGVIA
jgi:hypothetical protein